MMGEEKASSAVDSLITQEQYELFKILKKVDPKQLGAYLKKESPQAIAVMLAHVDSDRSGAILSALPQDSQIKVLLAMARLEESDPEIVTAMEKALTEDISSMTSGPGMKKTGGAQAVAKILNSMSASDNKFLMGEISEEDFELASDIKDLMFVFEDLILLEDKSLQVVMKEIEQSDLILSLKGANDTVKDKIFSNISKRQVESINDELAFMGPVKSSAVKQAQQSIVGVVRKLNEEGKLLIQSKGGGDDAIIN